MLLHLRKLRSLPPLHRSMPSPHFSTPKKIHKKQSFQKTLQTTISQMEKITQITLGPYGRTILIQNQMQSPRITKDGVTVVKHIQFEDRLEDAIAKLVKRSVDATNRYAGDGTTTATILIGEIIRIAAKRVGGGVGVREIRRGFEIARGICLQFLDSCSRKITTKQQLMNVAMISTNGKPQISSLVTQAISSSSTIRIQKSQTQSRTTTLQYQTCTTFQRGLDTAQLANSPKKSTLVYNYPLIVTSLQPINNVKDILKCLQLAKKARKQVIVFGVGFSDAVKSMILFNAKKGIVQAAWVLFPGFGSGSAGRSGSEGKAEEGVKKIAEMTGAFLFREFSGSDIADITYQQFGKAVKVEADMFETKIQVDEQKKEGNAKYSEAVIMVGGPNETAMLENYDHMIDALNSTKSAMKDGVVAGGGVTFWRLAQLLESYEGEGQAGIKILAQALKQPRIKLMQHVDPQKQPLSGSNWQGYDLKNQRIVDMFEAGIIDSVNVAKSVIIDSLSLCSVLIEVDIAIGRTDKNISHVSLKQLNSKYTL